MSSREYRDEPSHRFFGKRPKPLTEALVPHRHTPRAVPAATDARNYNSATSNGAFRNVDDNILGSIGSADFGSSSSYGSGGSSCDSGGGFDSGSSCDGGGGGD